MIKSNGHVFSLVNSPVIKECHVRWLEGLTWGSADFSANSLSSLSRRVDMGCAGRKRSLLQQPAHP